MNWYDKLNAYFPNKEMKSKEQFSALLNEENIYFKDEGPYHIAMYAEFEEFVFIDYLWVSKEARGKGIGRKVIEKFKAKGKTVILEVEPINEKDPDTSGRLKFYDKLGFKFVKTFRYVYQVSEKDAQTELDIMYYAPSTMNEEKIYDYMRRVHENIHTYKEKEFYGIESQKAEEVLKLVY